MKKNGLFYVALMLAVCVVWGFGFIVVKGLLASNVPALLLIAVRFAIGAAALALIRAARRHAPFTRAELGRGLTVGAVTLAAFACQTFGARLTTPAKNGLFTGLYVIFAPLMTLGLRRRFALKPIVTAILAFLGVVLVSGALAGRFDFNLGDALTLLCALSFAVQFVLLERYSPALDPLNFAIVQLIPVAGAALLCSLVLEPGALAAVRWAAAAPGFLFLGVLGTGAAYLVQTLVQAKLPAHTAAVVSCSESVFAVGFAILFGYDAPSLSLLLGSVLVMAAIVYAAATADEM
jgi:drug/metabolite transporter (DMT)-like permease